VNHGLRILTVAAGLVLFGCADPVAPPDARAELSTDRSSYASGDLGTLTLRNTASFRSLHVAWCLVALQRREGDEWVFVHGNLSGWEASGEASGAALSCFSSLRFVVQPRTTLVAPSGFLGFLLPGAETGEYRVALGVWQQPGDRRALVFSNSFHFVE